MEKLCADCIYGDEPFNEYPCVDCFNNVAKPHWEPYNINDDKNISMIKSIIDEAMEKRDRTVSVFISGKNMHVTVAPLGADEPRWIPKEGGYVCSTCGRWQIDASRYCCDCGEALKNMDMFDEESEEDEDDCQSEESDRVKFCVMCKHNIISPGYNRDDPVCDHCTNQDKFEPYGR